MVYSHPADHVSDKLLALGYHGDDPEIMSEQRQRQRGNSYSTLDSCCNSRESLVEIVLRRHTGLLERHLHDRRIVPQRIELATGEICRWEVLMVVLGQDRESVGVVGVGVSIPNARFELVSFSRSNHLIVKCGVGSIFLLVESLHALFINNRCPRFVVLVRLVLVLVFLRNCLPVRSDGHEGYDALETVFELWVFDDFVGDGKG